MKNGDLPAMPVEEGHLYQSRCDNGSWALGALGLTKREQFAIEFASAMVSNPQLDASVPASGVAKMAIEHADALLAELERTK